MDDEGMEKAYDELTREQKYEILQQMYQQYQMDPDNFPEEQ